MNEDGFDDELDDDINMEQLGREDRLGQDRLGQDRLEQDRLGWVRTVDFCDL